MTMCIDLECVTVVCVTYNSRALVPEMTKRLQPFPNVLIVDNGSIDGTATEISKRMPHAKLVVRQNNIGFGAANNEAIRRVETNLALLLNPDCDIDVESVRILMQCIGEHKNAALVAPQSWRGQGIPQKSWRPPFFAKQPPGPYRVPGSVTHAGWVHGCCWLVDVPSFQSVGGFDEQYFLYYEDDDLCLRLIQAGFDCLLQPSAGALHRGGASSKPSWRTEFIKRFHYARSRQIALRRYVGQVAAALHIVRLLVISLPAIAFYCLVLRPRDIVKWAAWGVAALCSALSLNSITRQIR